MVAGFAKGGQHAALVWCGIKRRQFRKGALGQICGNLFWLCNKPAQQHGMADLARWKQRLAQRALVRFQEAAAEQTSQIGQVGTQEQVVEKNGLPSS